MGSSPSVHAQSIQGNSIEEAKELIRNKEHLMELWDRIDDNGNRKVSLAEIHKMVVELAAAPGENQSIWEGLNNKPALMRAYKFTTLEDGNGDAYVQRKEFVALLRNLFFFSKLWSIFDAIDNEDEINGSEFQEGLNKLGFNLSDEDVRNAFNDMDVNDGGQILFDEFCAYCMKVVNADDSSMGITTIVRDVDSDDEAGIEKRKARKRRVVDRGSVGDYDGIILGTYNEKTGQWEGFLSDTSNPTMQDLHTTMSTVKEQARLDRQETLRLQMGLPLGESPAC